jgi:CDP-diacylglycerol---glycerol-3-phosphate 3-phosphatidyltransferase
VNAEPVGSRPRRSALLNAPNLLSLSRVALAPVFIWLLSYPGRLAGAVAAIGFGLACYSDWLDGHLARTRGQTTNLGKLLDPLADKILILSALIMLCAMPREPRIPAWIVAVIAVREVAVTGLRAIAREEGLLFGAETLGKAKTAFEVVSVFSLLVHYRYGPLDFFSAGELFLWVALALALWSGFTYHWRVGRALAARDATV